MNELTHPQLKTLLHADTPPCVSLYVPLSMAEVSEQGTLSGCYRNLLESAHALLSKNYSDRVTARMLAPLTQFQLPERLRGEKPSGTLAIFKSPTLEGYIHLPDEVPGISVVADSFHIKPLLDMLLPPRNFFVLDLQSRRATLYKGSREKLEFVQELLAKDAVDPTFDEDAKAGSNRFKRQLESLLTMTGLRRQESLNNHLSSEFVARVEAQVTTHMIFTLSCPLFIVGKRHLTNQYLRINRYPALHSTPMWAAEGRARNEIFLKSIHVAALKQNDKILKREKNKHLTTLRKARSKGLLVQDLNEIILALSKGQVRTLFIKRNELLWGTVDWKSARIRINPNQSNAFDDDIIDDCIERALGAAGTKIVCLEEEDLQLGEFINPVTAILVPSNPPLTKETFQSALPPLATRP